MHRLSALGLVIAGAAVPLLPATPAYAATNTICVNTTDPACVGPPLTTLGDALSAAGSDGQDSVVLLGPGTYTEPARTLTGAAGDALTVRGAGLGTVFTLPAASSTTYLSVSGARVEDLTVRMKGGPSSSGGRAFFLADGAALDGVLVDGRGDGGEPATENAIAVEVAGTTPNTVTGSQLLMPVSDTDSQGIRGNGVVTVTDSTLTAGFGSRLGSTPASTLSRVTIRASYAGVEVQTGSVAIDNSVIDLGATDATGVLAANFNNGDVPKSVAADHLTIVGGAVGSRGLWAYAAAAGAIQTTTVTLSNSVIEGPETSLELYAGNDGMQGGPSTATLDLSYTAYETVEETVEPVDGAGGIDDGPGNLLDVAPGFVDPAAGDYRLTAASPLVDSGDPAPGGPGLDRAAKPRVLDGDADGTATRDIGAYEYQPPVVPPAPDTRAPQTTFTKKPGKRVTTKKATFKFTADEPGVRFQCKRDKKPWKPCSSPHRWKKLKLGKHVFLVRAVDAAGNVDATPARYRFKRIPRPTSSGCTGEC